MLPIEHYPPVQNLINYLSDYVSITCFTLKSKKLDKFVNEKTIIKRNKEIDTNSISRLISHLLFYLKTFFYLLKHSPEEVIYYDSISSLPVWLYKIVNKRVKIIIHYHEYITNNEYETGMIITKLAHKYLEKKNYMNAYWISQTNTFRRDFFCVDNNLSKSSVEIMPNYPPKSWSKFKSKEEQTDILKIIYVGYSVNSKGNYIKELIKWLDSQVINIQLDFYLIDTKTCPTSLFKEYKNMRINLYNAINYDELPNVLRKYNIGIILYKPTEKNWIYNAPNKLFEYLSCDLDVWFPDTMIGSLEYENLETFPKVVSLDFENLDLVNFEDLIDKKGLKKRLNNFFSEEIYKKLMVSVFDI
jgi:hypothetical protein